METVQHVLEMQLVFLLSKYIKYGFFLFWGGGPSPTCTLHIQGIHMLRFTFTLQIYNVMYLHI